MTGNHLLFENTPAKEFTDAYPIGNGHLGAMVYGGTDVMRIGLNHDELWSSKESNHSSDWNPEDFYKARDFALRGDYDSATDILKNNFLKYDCGSYLPLGDIYIELPCGDVTNYRRELDIRNSVCKVTYKLNGAYIAIKAYASYPAGAIIIELKSEKPINTLLSQSISIKTSCEIINGTIINSGVCPSLGAFHKKHGSNPSDVSSDTTGTVAFATALTVKTDGKLKTDKSGIEVLNSTKTIIYFTAETSYRGGIAFSETEYKAIAISRIKQVCERNEHDLYLEHVDDVRRYYDLIELEFESPDYSYIPTSQRILRFSKDMCDTSLIALQFNYGRYLMIASSRKGTMATNLQGIWNDKMDPPWQSGYTTNINTQMNYWPALACGLQDMLEPFESLMRVVSVKGKKAAKDLYGSRGVAAGHNLDIFGFCTPTRGRLQWGFLPLSFAWMSRELFNRYIYTCDKDYLKSVYSILEDAALFLIDTMVDDGDNFIFSPATSPENSYIHPNGKTYDIAKSSTFYCSIAYDVIKNYISASEALDISNEDILIAKKMLPRILKPRITPDGRIEEWYFSKEPTDPIERDSHHRHISHLYGLYPGDSIDTPELMNAASRSLDVRGDESTGWSLAWKMCCRARLGDCEGLMRLIKLFIYPSVADNISYHNGGGVYNNLFCVHPPFQIDGNFAFTAAICELFVVGIKSCGGNATLIPKEFGKGSVRGLRMPGNKAANVKFDKGKITSYEIYTL